MNAAPGTSKFKSILFSEEKNKSTSNQNFLSENEMTPIPTVPSLVFAPRNESFDALFILSPI
jgi:hypothetical protein